MDKLEIRDDLKLILFKPFNTYSVHSIKRYISKVHQHQKSTFEYNRFIDLSDISMTKFSPHDIDHMTSIIKKFRAYRTEAVACFFCKEIGINRIASLFVEKMKPEFKNSCIASDIEDCAKFLNVEIHHLIDF